MRKGRRALADASGSDGFISLFQKNAKSGPIAACGVSALVTLVDGTTYPAWIAKMASEPHPSRSSPDSPAGTTSQSAVRLEVRQGSGKPVVYDVQETGFLIGSVPGCDLRLPGANLPPVICLLQGQTDGVSLRKLVSSIPVLVNGRATSAGQLRAGDQITIAATELTIQTAERTESLRAIRSQRTLDQTATDHSRQIEALRNQLKQKDREIESLRANPPQNAADLQTREASLQRQKEDLARVQKEMAEIRQELYDRYRERRDRLAGLQQAVEHAARKVQENKRKLELDTAAGRQKEAEFQARQADWQQEVDGFTERKQILDQREAELSSREETFAKNEKESISRMAKREQELQANQAQYQSDLVRLDRLQASIEERKKQLQDRAKEVDQRFEQLQKSSRELEGQAGELDEWKEKLRSQSDELTRRKAEQDASVLQFKQRVAAVEVQQGMVAALRTKLERTREEQERAQQQLAEQQTRLDATADDLEKRVRRFDEQQIQLDGERLVFVEEKRQLDDGRTELRELREQLSTKETELAERGLELEKLGQRLSEESVRLQEQSAAITQEHERLIADREALRERETRLHQSEQVRETLQDQLRRRSEELTQKQRSLFEQAAKNTEEAAALERRRTELEQTREANDRQCEAVRQALEEKSAKIESLRSEVAQQELLLLGRFERLKEVGRKFGQARKRSFAARQAWQAEQALANAELSRREAAFQATMREAENLRTALPDLELRAQAAVERLSQTRQQLRNHLAELHDYARQSQDDLDAFRSQVFAEAEQVQEQRQALHRARDEHRLAVAGFRQQLIEWQGQVTEMKRDLTHNETRLDRRQAAVDEKARQVDAGTARLAQQADILEEQERIVAERRVEVERHLEDMRLWYRQKLSELSAKRHSESSAAPKILALPEEVEPGDQKLGDLLRSHNLVEQATLESLLGEAHRQRRTLRQLLLAGGYLTLFQMALIETGNLDGLAHGPLRVIDRIRATPRESVYRVFDPRRSQEAMLRHLSEAEMDDAVHPDEFRQRFQQAVALQNAHVAATLEVLDIAGRPAVLQELVNGLPSSDWPSLVSIPGVWLRLLRQAARGLRACHQAGLVHGHLQADSLILTPEGTVKLCGVGEPLWLSAGIHNQAHDPNVSADLADLAKIASGWATLVPQRKGSASKNEGTKSILSRLTAQGEKDRYPDVQSLLDDLERSNLPADAESWERLLDHVKNRDTEDGELRESA